MRRRLPSMKLTITKGHVIAALIALVIGVGGGYFIGYEVEREHIANGIRHAFTQAKEVVKETSGTGKESAWTQASVKELQSKIEKESKTPPVTSTQAACSANQLAVKYTPTELEHSTPPTSVTDAIKVTCHIAVAPTTTRSAPSTSSSTEALATCEDGIAARDQICERSARIAEAKGIPLCPKGEQEEVEEEAHRNCEPQPSGD